MLDEQLEDREGDNAGRVDGIILLLRDGKPPLLTHVEVSPITLLARFNRRLGRWYARRDARLGPGRGVPYRIPWARLRRQGTVFRFDGDAESTPINAFEQWLRRTIVERLPWS
ncbi:MAG: hypothetical protein ACHQWU_04300 [Gemmatimonadales bacterium]